MKNPREFPVRPVDDWIIVDRIDIEDKQEKTSKKLDIQMVDGKAPMSIADIEAKKVRENISYADSKKAMLEKWEEHPNQGYVMAVGPGRPLEQDVIIPMPVKVGDHVYMRGSVGEPIIVNKNLYFMHKPHEIFAIVK